MSLHIYTSNRMERLLEPLSDLVAQPLASALTREIIVVQSKGMQRWLAMELAKRFGVWANCDYPFPNTMVWRLFRAVLAEMPDTDQFSAEVMTWKLMRFLPDFLEQEAFTPLRNYLGEDRVGLKHFQLAEKIADTFDQYTLFRPEMLLEWEAGAEGEWQAPLWRMLADSGNGKHRGRVKEEFWRQLAAGGPRGCFPERISVFGISYLPRYHMDVLSAAALFTQVHLFLLSPTREYWGDIVSARAQARMAPEQRELRIQGNPLLASLGKLGRDFSDMVIEMAEQASEQDDLYLEPGAATLLQAVQSDILNLRGAGPEEDRLSIRPEDRSIQIHSCHSPMREIEVLHDNLLALLDGDSGLSPREIVVMTPDIETYAPYITTVFDGCQEPSRKIPYSIADRRLARESPVASAFLKLLELPGSRLSVVQVLDLLESPAVHRRLGLDEQDLGTVRRWVEETRIRWGMDAQDRIRLGLPGYDENSWRSGLDRLFLGYAMPEESGCLFEGILPYDDIEGSVTVILGKLALFVEQVGNLSQRLGPSRPLGRWREDLQAVVSDFIATDDRTAAELAAVAGVLEQMGQMGEQSGYDGPVDFAVIRAWLQARLEKEQKDAGFLTGGVTFCAMLPMRSIPFRVVALIGMSDCAFPRQGLPPGFDLVARHPRRGDRSLRDEDRYLFLEAILSARECLYVSYVGQSIKDNSEITPSVLVSEFLDAIGRRFTAAEGTNIPERLVTRHRLQAFSREYFIPNSPLFSYSQENCAALLERGRGAGECPRFLNGPLSPPPQEWRDIPLPRFLRFFDNPARFFLENRLGIRLEGVAAPLDEREPFLLDGLDAYALKKDLLEIALGGGDPREYLAVARCRGILPPARHGEALFRGALQAVERFAADLRESLENRPQLPPLDFELELEGFRLSGRIGGIWPHRMIRYRCARMKGVDQLRAWIEHLVLNALQRPEYPGETLLVMADGTRGYRPAGEARGILSTLLAFYWEGLTQPLRFFPASAMEYARGEEWRIDRAKKAWEGWERVPGEKDDPHFRLCFGADDPFDEDFQHIARALVGPLVQHQQQEKA